MKPSWRILASALVLIAVVAGGYALYLRGHAVAYADMARQSALDSTIDTLRLGPVPERWRMRAFVPASDLQQTFDALEGSVLTLPLGQDVDGKVDGYADLVFDEVRIAPGDAELRTQIAATATYVPDRETPWWGGVEARVIVEALLLPTGIDNDEGVVSTVFRIVPQNVQLATGWSSFDLRSGSFLGVLAADFAVKENREDLVLSIPSIAVNSKFDFTKTTKTRQDFGDGNGTDLSLTTKREPLDLLFPLEHWLITDTGLWLLGTPSGDAAPPVVLSGSLEDNRRAVSAMLEPFRLPDTLAHAHVGSDIVAGVAKSFLSEPIEVSAVTSNPSDYLKNVVLLKDDNLGNVGFEVRPRGDDFGRASVKILKIDSGWTPAAGLTLDADFEVAAKTKLNLHVDAGIPVGGVDHHVDIDATATASVSARGTVREFQTQYGAVAAFEPVIDCGTLEAVFQPVPPGTFADLSYLAMSVGGLTYKSGIGGGQSSPAILLSELELPIELPVEVDKDEKPIVRSPSGSVFTYATPFLGMSFKTEGSYADADGIALIGDLTINRRSGELSEAELKERKLLQDALDELGAEVTCTTPTELIIEAADVKFLDILAITKATAKALNKGAEVGEGILAAIKDKNPILTKERLATAPAEVMNAQGQAIEDIFKASTSNGPPPPSDVIGTLEDLSPF